MITKDGKIITVNGKGLNFDSLVAQANEVTGKDDKTVKDAVQSLCEKASEGGITTKTWTIEFASYVSYGEFVQFVRAYLIGNPNVTDLVNAFTVKFINNPQTTRMGILANGTFYNDTRIRDHAGTGIVKRVGAEGHFSYGVDIAAGSSAEITIYGMDGFVPIT